MPVAPRLQKKASALSPASRRRRFFVNTVTSQIGSSMLQSHKPTEQQAVIELLHGFLLIFELACSEMCQRNRRARFSRTSLERANGGYGWTCEVYAQKAICQARIEGVCPESVTLQHEILPCTMHFRSPA